MMEEARQKEYTKKEIIDDIIAFNNDVDVQRLKAIYYNQTLPEIFAVSRRELTHSSFLAWLFATSSNHGLGNAPLVQLLELYVLKSREQKKKCITDKVSNAIITRDFHISECTSVTEEAVVTANARGRADIVLTSEIHFPNLSLNKLKIVIENKVYSDEHSNQTQTYFDYYESIKGKKEKVLYIYLTSPTSITDADCPEFIHITYQDLLEHVFEPLRRRIDISQRTQFILNEYISSLSIPADVMEDKNVTHIQTSILAIGMEEKELLQAFWDKNKTLIIAALTAISSDDDDNEATGEAQKLLQNLSQRDFSKYSINGSGKFGKNRMVQAVVNKYLEEHQDTTIAELKQIFPDNLQGSLGVIRTMQDTIKDYSRYYEAEHPKTKEKFFICNQWGGNTINFVDHVNAANLGIRIEKYK
ncbi:MAG: PD-(D/E)XK nuclease family protein [Paludibacteraceae bacterium]|nr:PD-(D/E)XK nuclease family protein [Paludibacteraceae bacterium]